MGSESTAREANFQQLLQDRMNQMQTEMMKTLNSVMEENYALRDELGMLQQQVGNVSTQPQNNAEQSEEQRHRLTTYGEEGNNNGNEEFNFFHFLCSCCFRLDHMAGSVSGSVSESATAGEVRIASHNVASAASQYVVSAASQYVVSAASHNVASAASYGEAGIASVDVASAASQYVVSAASHNVASAASYGEAGIASVDVASAASYGEAGVASRSVSSAASYDVSSAASHDEASTTSVDESQPGSSNKNQNVCSYVQCCVRRSRHLPDTDTEVFLPEDTFSFLITANVCSIPFFTGMVVFFLKTAIFVLFTINIIDRTKTFNKLGIPVAVDFSVSFSQFLTLLLSVFSKNDLVGAFTTYLRGYNDNIRTQFSEVGAGGGQGWQWGMSLLLAILDGIFGLAVTFLLIVTSSTVLDVLLNFAAVEFVAEIDETAFTLAEMGFISPENRTEAKLIKETKYTPNQHYRSDHPCIRIFKAGVVFFVLLVGLIFWISILIHQLYGTYSAQKILVQFDDQIRPVLGAHSGFYSLDASPSWNPASRFKYKEVRAGGGQFAYCQSRQEWRFAVEDGDHCDDTIALAKSINRSTYSTSQPRRGS